MDFLLITDSRQIKGLHTLVYCIPSFTVGAWDYMKWKHIIPIIDEKGTVLAAKLVVYPNEPDYNALKEWMDR